MAKIDLVEALESGEIKDARLQGTGVISIKYPTNELRHVKIKSLVAEFEDDNWESEADRQKKKAASAKVAAKKADSKVEDKKKK